MNSTAYPVSPPLFCMYSSILPVWPLGWSPPRLPGVLTGLKQSNIVISKPPEYMPHQALPYNSFFLSSFNKKRAYYVPGIPKPGRPVARVEGATVAGLWPRGPRYMSSWCTPSLLTPELEWIDETDFHYSQACASQAFTTHPAMRRSAVCRTKFPSAGRERSKREGWRGLPRWKELPSWGRYTDWGGAVS